MSVPNTLLSNKFVMYIKQIQNFKALLHDTHWKQKLDMLNNECFSSCSAFISEYRNRSIDTWSNNVLKLQNSLFKQFSNLS